MKCGEPARGQGCAPPRKAGNFLSLRDLLDDYRKTLRGRSSDQAGFSGWTLPQILAFAGRGELANGSRHPHLRRLTRGALRLGFDGLKRNAATIKAARDFAGLHDTIRGIGKPIRGLGELWVYDTALAIGTGLGLRPKDIYLHAGTAAGARYFGVRGAVWPRTAWPPEFLASRLSADELESFLCERKDELGKLSLKSGSGVARP